MVECIDLTLIIAHVWSDGEYLIGPRLGDSPDRRISHILGTKDDTYTQGVGGIMQNQHNFMFLRERGDDVDQAAHSQGSADPAAHRHDWAGQVGDEV